LSQKGWEEPLRCDIQTLFTLDCKTMLIVAFPPSGTSHNSQISKGTRDSGWDEAEEPTKSFSKPKQRHTWKLLLILFIIIYFVLRPYLIYSIRKSWMKQTLSNSAVQTHRSLRKLKSVFSCVLQHNWIHQLCFFFNIITEFESYYLF